MASATPSQQSTAVANFIEILQQARARPGYVSVPFDLQEEFKLIFRQRDNIEAKDVETVVAIVDSDDGNLFRRLDGRCLMLFCGILRLSVECRSQLRGYCLLAESLHDASAAGDPVNERLCADKAVLGANHMLHAFSKFLDSNRSELARRAYGLFVLMLIIGCPANKKQMQERCNDMELHALGHIVLGQEFEILKFTAACIIHEILGRELPKDRFWTMDDMPFNGPNSFPEYYTSIQWMWDLHSFFEKTNLQDSANQRRAVGVFANTIEFAGKTFDSGNHSTILVTVNTMLSIMVPAASAQPTVYIDIPIEAISRLESHFKAVESDTQSQGRSEHSQSQSRVVGCLNITLSTCKDSNQLMNYKPCHANAIAMVFDYERDVRTVERALEARRSLPANTISPSLLEYEPMSLHSEAATARSDAADGSLNREASDSTDEQSAKFQELTTIASDSITCMADDDTYYDTTHILGGRHTSAPHIDGETSSGGVIQPKSTQKKQNPPVQIQNNQVSHDDQSNGNVNANIKSSKQPVHNSHPRGSQGSLAEGSVQARIHSGESKVSNDNGSRRGPGTSKVPAAEASGKGSAQQNPSELDPSYGARVERSHTKRLPPVKPTSALAAQYETQEPRIPGRRDSKLSRQLRDIDGRIGKPQPAPSPDQNQSQTHTSNATKKSSVTKQSASTKRLSEPRVIPTSRVDTHNTNTRGPHKTPAKVRFETEKRQPKETSDQTGKESRTDRPPEASMIAKSKDKQGSRIGPTPAITSNSSRPRPKAEVLPAKVSNHASKPETKKRDVHDQDEQVDWSEAFQTDNGSDFAQPGAKNKTTKKRSMPTKPKKGKTGLSQRMEALSTKPTLTPMTGKPTRAAALKANKRIQGLADQVDEERHTPKKSPVENAPNPKSSSRHVKNPIKPSETSKKASSGHQEEHPLRPSNSRPLARKPKVFTLPENLPDDGEYQEEQALDSVQRRGISPDAALLTAADHNSPQGETMNPPSITPIGSTTIGIAASPKAIEDTVTKVDRQQPCDEAPVEQKATNSPINDIAGDISDFQHPSHPKLEALVPQAAQAFMASTSGHKIVPGDVINVSVDVPIASAQSEQNSKEVMLNGEAEGDDGDLGHDVFDDFEEFDDLALPKPSLPIVTKHDASLSEEPHLSKGNRQQQQNQASREEETKAPPAPTKKRSIVSKLQAALSPIPALQSREEGRETKRRNLAAQHVQESGDIRAPMQNPTANIPHELPKEGNPEARQKRPSQEADPRQAKKSKVAGSTPQDGSHLAQAEIQTPHKKLLTISKKPNLIHFDASGPRNQGIQSTKKTKAPAQTTLPSLHADPLSEANQRNKRKVPDLADDGLVAPRHSQNGKRLKINHRNPGVAEEDVDTQVKKPTSSSTDGQTRVHSSQSSRVDEYGSPLPFHHSRKSSLAIPKAAAAIVKISPPLSAVSDTEDLVTFLVQLDPNVEPKLPVARHSAQPTLAECKPIVASNRKHRPSSPNAAGSIISDMTAHTVQPSGNFIGLQTNDVVVPQRPKDPFIEMTQDRPVSKFMETLRKSSITHGQKEEARRNKEDGDEHTRGNDPDKTLIGEPGSPGDEDSSTTSGSSASSHSSNSQKHPDSEPSEGESDPGDAWNKALRPDQRNIFVQLCEIGHQLTQNLIDKETAIRDKVKDYRNQGHYLIGRFEEERQRELDTHRSERSKATKVLLKTFQSAAEDCATRISESQKGIIDFRVKMETRQTKENAAMEGLLALCDQSE